MNAVTATMSAVLNTTVSTADEDLVARMGRGDRDAWGELYRRHRATVTGYVTRRITCEADVEDLVHETFLHAWSTAGDYRPEQGYQVRSWLCGRAGLVLRRWAWNDRHPYLAAVDATREAMVRPVTETADERESRPLSEPVRAALEQLTASERRAVQLRYLDGLNGAQAAEAAGCRAVTIGTNAMNGRQKLARALAELVPPARSHVQEMPRREAVHLALSTVGDDVPAAREWLREHGVRVDLSTVYRARHSTPPDAATPIAAADRHRPAPAAYSPPSEVTALGRPTDRARAASRDYRTRYGRLPTITQLAEAVQVTRGTAAYALRDVEAEPPTPQLVNAAAGEPGAATASAVDAGDTGVARDEHEAAVAGVHPLPAAHDQPAAPIRPRGNRLRDVRSREADPSRQLAGADPGARRHPVRVPAQAAYGHVAYGALDPSTTVEDKLAVLDDRSRATRDEVNRLDTDTREMRQQLDRLAASLEATKVELRDALHRDVRRLATDGLSREAIGLALTAFGTLIAAFG
jgi:RNA polymerase sigma-70 factor (ECF subfamily)